jgi:uncharacterized protein (DUF1810 family)
LTRFHQAQSSQWGGYATALAEMRRGHKSSHWIWYIFPQIDGLGRSSTAREYALRDLAEACDYLRDPVLRARYEEISHAIEEQLARDVDVETLMGGSTDALKLASSLTLFRAAANRSAQSDPTLTALARRCDSILQKLTAQSYPPCEFTRTRIESEL